MTRVQDLMSSPALTCRLTDSVNRAAQVMWEHDCGSVAVVDDLNHVVGVVTDRDVCMGAYTQGRPLFDILVSSVCSRDVHSIAPDDSLQHAQTLMKRNQVRRLPVIDHDGALVGMLSLSDLSRHASAATAKDRGSNAVSSVVEAVSRWRHGLERASVEITRSHEHPDAGRRTKPSS